MGFPVFYVAFGKRAMGVAGHLKSDKNSQYYDKCNIDAKVQT